MGVAQDVVPAPKAAEPEREKRPFSRELWFLVVVAIALALTMKAFFIQAFFIPSGSMEKTLHGCPGCPGDRVLVNKVVYRFRDIHRGEIVVFSGKGTRFFQESSVLPPANGVAAVLRKVQSALGLGSPDDKDFIKRVIGVPGDIVACCVDGKVTVNGQPIDEPYVHLTAWAEDPAAEQSPFLSVEEDCFPGKDRPVPVPEGHLFLMGDHRDGSSDSRYNCFVPIENVVGRAFAVFWPLPRAKVLTVPETFTQRALGGDRRGVPAGDPDLLGVAFLTLVPRLRRRKD